MTEQTNRAAGAKPATDKPAAPAAAAAAEPVIAKTADTIDAKRGSYVVAPGRTVMDHDGENIGPGGKVNLTADEATRLLKHGFILDKDGAIVVQTDGPAVNVDEGVQIAPEA